MNLEKLTTEQRNPDTMNLDQMTSLQIVQTMNDEDNKVPAAIKDALPKIAEAVDEIVKRLNENGRLIYIGAGTSGRLGVLDAAECVPTFGTEPELVQGLIAGGMSAMTVAVEGAEDSLTLAKEDLKAIGLTKHDVVVGIAASGRTPYVIGGLKYAESVGAQTISIACNQSAEISKFAHVAIEVSVGPEVLSGSTRLKSGTAQKMILNMLSTASMVRIGKAFGNLMVDVRPTNEKLVERSKRIIMMATDANMDEASKYFELANQNVKLAIVMILTNSNLDDAKSKLTNAKGFVRNTL